MTPVKLTVDFADHASDDEKRLILSFLNALTGSTEAIGHSSYSFAFTKESKIQRARDGLSDWTREGLIYWREES